MDTRTTPAYCLAHGLITLHLCTETGRRRLPAALYHGETGEEALCLAGPRVRRVARWDAAGWETWWALLAHLCGTGGWVGGGRPAMVALPPSEESWEIPDIFPTAYAIPPTVAVRAASPVPEGVALYLGAFAWEAALFGLEGVGEPTLHLPGLEPLYRTIIAEVFRQERRPLLPVQVPALLQEGLAIEVDDLLEAIAPLLDEGSVVFGGEDDVVVAAVARVLEQRGCDVVVVDPLTGLERIVWAVGPFPGTTLTQGHGDT